MAITQTVDIPADRRITVPAEVPTGPAQIMYFPAPEPRDKDVPPFSSFRGMQKGKDTLDAYFERKRADKAKEDAQILRQLGLDEFPKVPKEG